MGGLLPIPLIPHWRLPVAWVRCGGQRRQWHARFHGLQGEHLRCRSGGTRHHFASLSPKAFLTPLLWPEPGTLANNYISQFLIYQIPGSTCPPTETNAVKDKGHISPLSHCTQIPSSEKTQRNHHRNSPRVRTDMSEVHNQLPTSSALHRNQRSAAALQGYPFELECGLEPSFSLQKEPRKTRPKSKLLFPSNG